MQTHSIDENLNLQIERLDELRGNGKIIFQQDETAAHSVARINILEKMFQIM